MISVGFACFGTCQLAAQVSFVNFLPFRMLFYFRTGQCIGPCAPSIAALPPAAPYTPLQYAPAQFASLPASIPLELPNKRKKPSSSSSSSSHSSTSTHTLQRKLRKRERAKALSSCKNQGRTKPATPLEGQAVPRHALQKDGATSAAGMQLIRLALQLLGIQAHLRPLVGTGLGTPLASGKACGTNRWIQCRLSGVSQAASSATQCSPGS